jgi:hypothetical protein
MFVTPAVVEVHPAIKEIEISIKNILFIFSLCKT